MTILVALTGWDVGRWVDRLRAALPGRQVVALGEPFDRRAVHYAVSWKHPPGSLAGLPNLGAVFSLGAGVDHLMGDPRLPDLPQMEAYRLKRVKRDDPMAALLAEEAVLEY